MASQTADDQGFVTTKTLNHYRRLLEANPGLLIVEYTYVHSTGKSEDAQLGIQNSAHIEGLTKLARLIRQAGAVPGIQITHGGGKTERRLTGGQIMGPSAVAVPVKDRALEVPEPMSLEDIALWKSSFLEAVDRAILAGFEVVEFHSAHGYGLNQWLSPITNQRGDAYGNTLSGRTRLLLEIISAVRLKHPGLAISVRMPGQDFIEGGLGVKDSIDLAKELQRVGVSLIHVSSGIGGWRRPRDRAGEGYLVREAEQIQAALQIPVIGVGGIESGAYIDQALSTRRFALAAVGRAILKDPRDWAERNLWFRDLAEGCPRMSHPHA